MNNVTLDSVTLDTNVLLDRTFETVLESFTQPTRVNIPLVVLEEFDTFKKGFEAKNEYARAGNRFLDGLRKKGKLHEGVEHGEHIVQVIIKMDELDMTKPDYRIIITAKETNSMLISQDINVRVVADALDVPCSMFAPNDVNVNELYTGHTTYPIYEEEASFLRDYHKADGIPARDGHGLTHNQFVRMDYKRTGEVYYGIYKADTDFIMALDKRYNAWGVKPKNDREGNLVEEQHYLMHMLLDPNIQFITAIGPSGTGKTLLTLAAALHQSMTKNTYKKVTVMRPLIAVGNDIGFLPGDKMEKLEPWMASTFDALEYLLEDFETEKESREYRSMAEADASTSKEKIYGLIQTGKLELEAMAHVRGRSLANQILIIDDAQNLTQHEATTIITRAGEGTKVIFLGDLSEKQIDNHRLTPSSNGLAYVIDRFKGEDIVGHITMNTVVRSPLAQLGVEKL